MAIPAWPDGLPYKPVRDGWGIKEPFRKPRVTEFEDGPDLMRKTSLQRRAAHKVKLDFIRMSDFEIFRKFVETDLSNGTQRFSMPVWVPAASAYQLRDVQIEGGLYTSDTSGMGMSVSFTLRVFDW